jgi:hypothetical protein
MKQSVLECVLLTLYTIKKKYFLFLSRLASQKKNFDQKSFAINKNFLFFFTIKINVRQSTAAQCEHSTMLFFGDSAWARLATPRHVEQAYVQEP